MTLHNTDVDVSHIIFTTSTFKMMRIGKEITLVMVLKKNTNLFSVLQREQTLSSLINS